MAGVQEILVLVIIILAIFFVPRIMGPARPATRQKIVITVSAKMRLLLGLSAVWLLGTAMMLRPWQKDLTLFLYVGVGPVLLGWMVRWVVSGFKKEKRGMRF